MGSISYFSGTEIRDIAISTIALGIIFSIGRGITVGSIAVITIIVALSFIPHELAHKFVAIKYKCFARYEMWKNGLMFALVLAIITNGSFTFAAPGAVVIYTAYRSSYGIHHVKLSSKQNGIISMAGPITNLAIALAFRILAPQFALTESIVQINTFLAWFNLLPIPPLDGSKIIWWNIAIWLILFGTASALLWVF